MRRHAAAWVVVLVLATTLRVVRLGEAPPGLQADEASNVFNARCIAATLLDEHKALLPVFTTRAFNDNRSTLFLYVLAPLAWIDESSTFLWRLPGAVTGVAAAALLGILVTRVLGRPAGLLAAALAAIDPTLVQHTRSAHESSITPLLILGTLAAWQAAGLILRRDDDSRRSRLGHAAAAGMIAGVSCYGYPSVRIVLPMLLVAALALTGRWRDRAWRRAAGFAMAAMLLIAGPLAFKHLTDAAINERFRATRIWASHDSAATIAVKLMTRYAAHFSPRFLFLTGSTDPALAPPAGFGALTWGAAPMLGIGLIVLVAKARRSWTACWATAAVAVYPLADVASTGGGPANVLRCLGTWWVFSLLAMAGLAWSLSPLRRSWIQRSAAGLLALIVINALVQDVRLLIPRATDAAAAYARGQDYEEAGRFLRGRLQSGPVIVVSTKGAAFCYPQLLVAAEYPVAHFFTTPSVRGLIGGTESDLLLSIGSLFFDLPVDGLPEAIAEAVAAAPSATHWRVLRPDERRAGDRVLHECRLPDGRVSLLVVERERH